MSVGNLQFTQQSFFFWDTTGNNNPVAPHQCVSLATAAEVTAARAAGCAGREGEIVVLTPVAAGLATRRVVGITRHAQFNLLSVSVATGGTVFAVANAAIAYGPNTLVMPAAIQARTTAQTPFTHNFELKLPWDPRASLIFNLCLIDDTAITPSSSGANQLLFPLGYAQTGATAQYDIIPVMLATSPFYF